MANRGQVGMMGARSAWSYCVLDADGAVMEERDADHALRTASIGKIFLLCEIAERIVEGRLDAGMAVERRAESAVRDSGLWQHLMQDTLPLADACVLVAAVSDNWATNVLLDVVGLDAVAARAEALGCQVSRLHDAVRDVRGPTDRPDLSTGTARELATVSWRIHRAARGSAVEGITPAAGAMVEDWLRTGVDLSLVADSFDLDPLAHVDAPVRLWSKTGADAGVRADVGVAWTDSATIAFAAIVNAEGGSPTGRSAREEMRELGRRIRQLIEG